MNIQRELLIILVLVLLIQPSVSYRESDPRIGPKRESSTAKLLRSNGYKVEDHYVKVQDKQITLSLIHATNPLMYKSRPGRFSKKEPLLFLHGILMNANAFLLLNEGVKPRNYSSHDINSMSAKKLKNLLKDDPGSQSLVFTALNFGYEVWLLNRRSTNNAYLSNDHLWKPEIDIFLDAFKDRGIINFENESEIDNTNNEILDNQISNYWNYTLDDQALYDLPETIDYILKKSNKQKLTIIGHSCGTTITLMALSDKPELADKVSKAILWAPVMDLEYGASPGLLDTIFLAILPIVSRIKVPVLPQLLLDTFESITPFICTNRKSLRYSLICKPLFELLGKGVPQLQLEKLVPEKYWSDTIGSLEGSQFYQSVVKHRMHHFDYGNRIKNLKAYGQPEPPVYDVSRIKLETISFWFGSTDAISREENFRSMKENLSVPIEEHLIGGSRVKFNHLAFMVHRDITDLLVIPSLLTIGRN